MLIAGLDPYLGTLGLAGALGYHGYHKGSLSASGGLAAAAVGYAHLANPHPAFGALLLGFYFTGSRATKVKATRKAELELELFQGSASRDEHKSATGGRRDVYQVLCNSLLPAVAAIAYRTLLSREPFLATTNLGFAGSWLLGGTDRASLVSAALLFLATGHYACCMGDTLASELGILSKTAPRLVTKPTRIVPPGTNGGMSRWGTFCSALGGTAIGMVLTLSELSALSSQASLASVPWTSILYRAASVVGFSTLAGLGGSLIDSLLGATLQRTWFRTTIPSNPNEGQVLVGRLPHEVQAKSQEHWTVISGNDVLSNNAVNALSSCLTASSFAVMTYFALF